MAEIRWKQRFENFEKANSDLNETYLCIKENYLNKIYTMALIQAFEMAFELSWKTLKDYLDFSGIKTDTPREAIKAAFSGNLIKDGQSWIEMMEARNKTSHTYREEIAKQIKDDISEKYIPLLNEVEKTLRSKLNE